MVESSPGLRASLPPGLLLSVGGALGAGALGWVSAMLSIAGKAPAGLLSLAIGAALGVLLIALAELFRANSRRALVVAALLTALVAIASEHGWLYREYRQKWRQNRVQQPAVALFRREASPLSLPAYFAREIAYSPRQTWFWALDASLIVAGIVGVVMLKETRRPPEP